MSEGSNHSVGSSSPRASKQQKRRTDASPGNAAPAGAAAAAAAAASGTSPADAVDVEMTELSPPTAVQNAAHVSLIPDFTSASFTYAEGSNIKYLLCGLCTLPLVKPLEHNPCRLPFCSACVQVSPAPACPECAVPIRLNKTASPTRTVQMQLDDLVVVCQDCKKEMPRGTFEAHWRDECPQLCPFAAPALAEDGGAVCNMRLPRSELNAHIDSCKFAPVECSAAQYGCVWQGQREALASHASSCPHVVCAPDFKRLLGAQEAELRRMRVALETREAQLKSYKAAGGAYALGTIVDAEDTEKQWLIARIIKVDLPKKMYRIHYEDWDASWDEWFPFNSTRLAPAGTHTTSADVEKHTEKAVTGTLCGSVDANTTNGGAASSVSASPLSVDDFTQPFHLQSSAGAAGGSTGPAAAAAASPLKVAAGGTLSGTKRKKGMVAQ